MKTQASATLSDYASGYAEGRHAAKELVPGYANPHSRHSAAYQGWNDGHYDERSARSLQIQRNSAAVWAHDD